MSAHRFSKDRKAAKKFTVGSIDNTAPVKKIVDHLSVDYPQAHAFYRQIIKQRVATKTYLRNFHHATPGHPLHAFDDDWDGNLNMEYFESFDYRSSLPKIITPLKNINVSDPVTDFIRIKMKWKTQLKNFKKLTGCKRLNKYEVLNEDVYYCPKEFVTIAAHIDSNPDVYFDSVYNWYYAGNGNLQLICINWVDYILCSELHILYLHRFRNENVEVIPDCIATFDCGENNNIFETICSTHHIVALRMKHKIIILKIEISIDDNNITFQKIKAINSEVPYTSITFDSHHENILYVVTVDGNLTIVNLDRMKGRSVKLKSSKKDFVNNWSTVIGAERSYYTHFSYDRITTYDKRNNNIIHTWKDLKHFTDEVNCNVISAAKQIEGNPIMYFATDHHLFTTDVRMFNKSGKILQRWTHGMQCNPTYISLCNFQFNKELICLSSQWCADMCVFHNYNSTAQKLGLNGVSLPYRPPSIFTTLKEARENMLCNDIYNPIDHRLSTAITGNIVFEDGDKYNILLQNSLGDISWHILYPLHYEMFVEDNSATALHDWCKDLKAEKKIFEVSAVKNIAVIRRCLSRIPEEYPFKETEESVKKKSNFDEDEIKKVIDNADIDPGLLELWTKQHGEFVLSDIHTVSENEDLDLQLHYSELDTD